MNRVFVFALALTLTACGPGSSMTDSGPDGNTPADAMEAGSTVNMMCFTMDSQLDPVAACRNQVAICMADPMSSGCSDPSARDQTMCEASVRSLIMMTPNSPTTQTMIGCTQQNTTRAAIEACMMHCNALRSDAGPEPADAAADGL
jgi:hypothetical protein